MSCHCSHSTQDREPQGYAALADLSFLGAGDIAPGTPPQTEETLFHYFGILRSWTLQEAHLKFSADKAAIAQELVSKLTVRNRSTASLPCLSKEKHTFIRSWSMAQMRLLLHAVAPSPFLIFWTARVIILAPFQCHPVVPELNQATLQYSKLQLYSY